MVVCVGKCYVTSTKHMMCFEGTCIGLHIVKLMAMIYSLHKSICYNASAF